MELNKYLSDNQKRRRKRQGYLYLALFAVVLYLVVAGAVWIFVRSPLFRARNIVVEGNRAVPSADVITLLQSATLRDHGFIKSILGFRNMLIWPDKLSGNELIFIPRLLSVELSKNYFSHTITVHVTEREPFGIWCFIGNRNGSRVSERCYWFDDKGIIFGRTFDTQGSLLFAIHDYSQPRQGLNKTILSKNFLDNFISIINVLKASGTKVKDIILEDIELQEMVVKTYDGPTLRFSLRFPADEDLQILQNLMSKPNFAKLEYIDFRVENRAYYK